MQYIGMIHRGIETHFERLYQFRSTKMRKYFPNANVHIYGAFYLLGRGTRVFKKHYLIGNHFFLPSKSINSSCQSINV